MYTVAVVVDDLSILRSRINKIYLLNYYVTARRSADPNSRPPPPPPAGRDVLIRFMPYNDMDCESAKYSNIASVRMIILCYCLIYRYYIIVYSSVPRGTKSLCTTPYTILIYSQKRL